MKGLEGLKGLKRSLTVAALLMVAALVAILSGCVSGPPGSNWLDRTLYTVETNYVPHVIVRTNTVTVTNFVPVVVGTTNVATVTNEVGVVVQQTNVVTVTNVIQERIVETRIAAETNLVATTSLAPKKAAEDTIRTVGGIAGTFTGAGGLISTGLLGLYSLYRGIRNKKVTGALVQQIETAREVLSGTPQGEELFDRYTRWLQQHQRAAGVLDDVRKLVEANVDNEAAREAAKLLLPAPTSVGATAPVAGT